VEDERVEVSEDGDPFRGLESPIAGEESEEGENGSRVGCEAEGGEGDLSAQERDSRWVGVACGCWREGVRLGFRRKFDAEAGLARRAEAFFACERLVHIERSAAGRAINAE
jgi:hypothetical protein